MPLPRDSFQRALAAFGFKLFSAGRVNAAIKLFFGFGATFPRFFQRKLGVHAESEEFLSALDAVFQPPALGAAGGDKRKKTVAVKEFLRLGGGLDIADGGIGERHGGISPGKELYTPISTPKRVGCLWFFPTGARHPF